jgi:hypothetical protein
MVPHVSAHLYNGQGQPPNFQAVIALSHLNGGGLLVKASSQSQQQYQNQKAGFGMLWAKRAAGIIYIRHGYGQKNAHVPISSPYMAAGCRTSNINFLCTFSLGSAHDALCGF